MLLLFVRLHLQPEPSSTLSFFLPLYLSSNVCFLLVLFCFCVSPFRKHVYEARVRVYGSFSFSIRRFIRISGRNVQNRDHYSRVILLQFLSLTAFHARAALSGFSYNL